LKTSAAFQPGQTLHENGAPTRWRVVERLATGRSFHLWRVDDLHIEGHRPVAKEIRYAREDAAHIRARRALLDAERDLYVLPSTMLPEPLDWLVVGDEPILVYEHQHGETLESFLGTRHPQGLGEARAARLVRELAHFAADLHEAGFVLCDLSPGHVVIGLDDVLRVIGLGNATRSGRARPDRREKVSWTEGFSAPELREGGEIRPSADVYSLGALLPFLALGDRGGRLSGALGDLCATCTSPDPSARPSASRLYEILRRGGLARPAPRPEIAAKPPPAGATARPAPAEKRPAPPPASAPEKRPAPTTPPKRPGRFMLIWILLSLAVAAGVSVAVYFLHR
jgi:serine/threonine protein kinase